MLRQTPSEQVDNANDLIMVVDQRQPSEAVRTKTFVDKLYSNIELNFRDEKRLNHSSLAHSLYRESGRNPPATSDYLTFQASSREPRERHES